MDTPAAFCRHLGACGGCSVPHRAYPTQLQAKEAALRAALSRVIGRSPALEERLFASHPETVVGSVEPRAFRQKVAFVFGAAPGGRSLVMGHYERGTQHVVPVTECPVHSARGNRIAFALREYLARAGILAAGPGRLSILRHLVIRATADDREAIAMLVVSRNEKPLRAPVRALLQSRERPDGFFININAEPGPFMVGAETVRIDGRSHVRERVGGLSFLISPTTFFQTNVVAAAALQRTVLEAVDSAARVLDLYCGSGLLSLPMAAAGKHVIAVEESRQAIRDAEANRRLNRIPPERIRFIPARVEDAAETFGRERWDAVVIDPPRQGCSPVVLDAVFRRLASARVVYVSCNLQALAQELPTALAAGYRVKRIQAVDMFPHTEHIETVVTLERTR